MPIMNFSFKRKPYQHQLIMIEKCVAHRKFALLCEMGTGKTQGIINTFQVLKELNQVKKGIIICPKSVMSAWAKEIPANCEYQYVVIKGTRKQRIKLFSLHAEFYIINYEALLTLEAFVDWTQFDMAVLDESSKIKNPQAKRTKLIINLFKATRYKFIMSGTPITQSPLDIYCQYEFLNPEFLKNKSWYSFRNTYAIMGGYGGYEIIAYKHLDRLKRLIGEHAYQLKKEDCIDLPAKIYEQRDLQMSTELKKQYDTMRKELMLELESGEVITASIVLTKILRLQQILSGAYLTNPKSNVKLLEVDEIIADTDEQVVIWCKFRDTVKLLEQLCISKKMPYSVMHGDIEDRGEQIEKFQSGNSKIFIGQIQTGGMGITLTAANVVIYYENTFSLQDRLQSEDRSHRIGQRKNVVYIDLLYQSSIDEIIMSAISDKQDVAHILVECFKGGKYE